MPRDYAVIIEEMIAVIDEIDQVLAGLTFEQYAASWVVRRAVERGLEIISEASRRLPSSLTTLHQEVPWPRVHALGNILRHDYHEVVDRVLWTICQDDLPVLKLTLMKMRSKLE